MSCRFPPNHWYPKSHWLSGSRSPLLETFNKCLANKMRSPGFVLVSKLYPKICKICSSYKVCDRLSVIHSFIFTANVTEAIRMIFARSWCHKLDNYKSRINHLPHTVNTSSKHRYHNSAFISRKSNPRQNAQEENWSVQIQLHFHLQLTKCRHHKTICL